MSEKTKNRIVLPRKLLPRSAPIIERAPLPIVEVQGRNHLVTYVNSAFCTLLEKSRIDLIGKPFCEIVPKGEDCVPVLDRVYETGEAATLAKADDDEASHWLFAMWPALDEEERPVGVIIQLTKAAKFQKDVTAVNEALLIAGLRQHEMTAEAEHLNAQLLNEISERKEAEDNLRESEKETRRARDYAEATLRTAPVPLLILNADLRVDTTNEAFSNTFQVEPGKAKGKLIYDLGNRQWNIPELRKLLEDILPKNKVFNSYEVTHEFESIGRRTMLLNARRMENETGQPLRIVLAIEDITARKEIERELQDSRQQITRHTKKLETQVLERTAQLATSVKSLQDLNYTMAHDLRAPIRAMKGLTSILLEDFPLDETGKTFAKKISAAASQMGQLVDDLLEYGELSHREFPMQTLDLKEEVKEALAENANDIQEARAEVEVRDPLPGVSGNKTLLKQILSNLLLNAVKFVPEGISPKILIHAEARGSMVRVWVEDQGIGIEEQYHEKIFGVFQRLHRSEEYLGTGVGLAIVKRAIDRMGGRAGVESCIGEGSKFWIELPEATARL
jgi:PAS domain S-box-containing protein